MSKRGFAAAAVMLSCILGGCGGDESSPSTPSRPNKAPAITSGAADVSVTENSTAALFAIVANDPDGDRLSFSLSGDDAALFAVDATGQVTFAEAPNYDRPRDRDRDNVYLFDVAASDGKASTSISARVEVTNDREGIRVKRILVGLSSPVGFARTNLARQLIVAERDGGIYLVDGQTSVRSVAPITLPVGSRLADVAFGPDNAFFKGPILVLQNDRYLSLYRDTNILTDATLAYGNAGTVAASVYFDNAGRLFASVGDPSGNIAQVDDRSSPTGFGKVFFADPARAYDGASLRGIPLTRIAKGLQSAGGLSEIAGNLLVGDRGSSVFHEISMFDPADGLFNLAWPYFEGTRLIRNGASGELLQPALTYPYGEESGEGLGIVLGTPYSGAIPGLRNSFVFGDKTGTIWSIELQRFGSAARLTVDDIENRSEDFKPDAGTIDQPVEITRDAAGNIYILDGDGEIFRVDPA